MKKIISRTAKATKCCCPAAGFFVLTKKKLGLTTLILVLLALSHNIVYAVWNVKERIFFALFFAVLVYLAMALIISLCADLMKK